jgi:hypothetical protein
MTKHTYDMVLEYAKVFEDNLDMGDENHSEKWMRELYKSGGQSTVNAYFTSEEQIADLEANGFERMTINPKTKADVDRIKDGNPDFGIGKYIVLKRKFSDPKEVKDRKTGEFKIVEFGGLAKIVDLRNLPDKRLWSLEEDGFLGNGTEAKVMFDVYKGIQVRLEAIGVTKLVEWEANQTNPDQELFKVA